MTQNLSQHRLRKLSKTASKANPTRTQNCFLLFLREQHQNAPANVCQQILKILSKMQQCPQTLTVLSLPFNDEHFSRALVFLKVGFLPAPSHLCRECNAELHLPFRFDSANVSSPAEVSYHLLRNAKGSSFCTSNLTDLSEHRCERI